MIAIVVRALSTVVAVVIAVAVSASMGENASGKIVASALIAAVIVAIEGSLIWVPNHSAHARRLLDRRSVQVGVWVQNVTEAYDASGRKVDSKNNSIAIYWIDFVGGEYKVSGFAYGTDGKRWAYWWSDGSPTFSEDGRRMTYQFKGTIAGESDPGDLPERRGITALDLGRKRGRVEHVGVGRILLFDVVRVTREFLAQHGFSGLSPDDLKDPTTRDEVAEVLADERRAGGHV